MSKKEFRSIALGGSGDSAEAAFAFGKNGADRRGLKYCWISFCLCGSRFKRFAGFSTGFPPKLKNSGTCIGGNRIGLFKFGTHEYIDKKSLKEIDVTVLRKCAALYKLLGEQRRLYAIEDPTN